MEDMEAKAHQLTMAAMSGDTRMVRLLLPAEGAYLEYALRLSFISADLVIAAEIGDNEKLLKLLSTGADVATANNAAIVRASERGHTETVQILLMAGADLHAEADLALRAAAHNGHNETVRVLLEAGANVHSLGDSPLRWAALAGHCETVKMLLNAGANIDACSDLVFRENIVDPDDPPVTIKMLQLLIKNGLSPRFNKNFNVENLISDIEMNIEFMSILLKSLKAEPEKPELPTEIRKIRKVKTGNP
jgi:ankyrin repeat protein